jgi:hypothetical protein
MRAIGQSTALLSASGVRRHTMERPQGGRSLARHGHYQLFEEHDNASQQELLGQPRLAQPIKEMPFILEILERDGPPRRPGDRIAGLKS